MGRKPAVDYHYFVHPFCTFSGCCAAEEMTRIHGCDITVAGAAYPPAVFAVAVVPADAGGSLGPFLNPVFSAGYC